METTSADEGNLLANVYKSINMQSKLITFLLGIIFSCALSAQYPCVNGISTNPLNPINTQLPSKKNTFFNWMDSLWSLQPSPFCFRTSQVESPFYKTDNVEELRVSKDMNWDDGWELIRRHVGLTETNSYTVTNPEHLYVILYNKYTGILRVLLQVCRGADYNSAKVVLKFHNLSFMKTDLLEFARGNITPLNKKFTSIDFGAGSKYVNENSKWFYADFPLMYDPCTCAYTSKLNIVSQLISNSTISLEGSIAGDLYAKDVGGKAQIQKSGSYSWKDFSNTINGKVTAVHGSVDKFVTESQKFAENIGKIDTAKKNETIDQLANFLKNNQFLKSGLNAVPWLKTVVSLVDVFIGGGKQTPPGPQQVKVMPMTLNLTAKLNGTITTSNPYHDIIFTNPGSKDAQLDPDAYPYYNEVLGVFNLLRSPVMYFQWRIDDITEHGGSEWGHRVRVNNYKFNLDSLKYVLNPAAGVTIQNMKVAMVLEANPQLTGFCADADKIGQFLPDFVYEGKDAITNVDKYRTDYYDVNCFNQRVFETKSYFGVTFPDEDIGGISCWMPQQKVYLKFMLNLRRLGATATTQNILYVITYPMNLKDFDIASNFTDNQDCIDSTVVPSATNLEVNSFCNSSQYLNLDRQSIAFRDSATLRESIAKDGIAVSPNPNNGIFNLYVKKQKEALVKIRVVDISGRTVYMSSEGNKNLENGYTKSLNIKIPSGVYYILVETKKKILQSKFIIAK
jgi:hypothetical protein